MNEPVQRYDLEVRKKDEFIALTLLNAEAIRWVCMTALNVEEFPEELELKIPFTREKIHEIETLIGEFISAGFKVHFRLGSFYNK